MAVSEMDFFVARKAEGDLCEAYIEEVYDEYRKTQTERTAIAGIRTSQSGRAEHMVNGGQ